MTMELFKGLLLLAFLAPAVWLDQRYHRIPNPLTGSLLIAGVLLNASAFGVPGAVDAVAGAFVGFGILLAFYALGAMAAGDVKLMAAVGACVGLDLTLVAVGASLLVGGVLGTAVFACRFYLDGGIVRFARFPFASAIAAGTAAALVAKDLPWTL